VLLRAAAGRLPAAGREEALTPAGR
jgi:hypothetical protein